MPRPRDSDDPASSSILRDATDVTANITNHTFLTTHAPRSLADRRVVRALLPHRGAERPALHRQRQQRPVSAARRRAVPTRATCFHAHARELRTRPGLPSPAPPRSPLQWLRYAQWAFNTPLLIAALGLLAGTTASELFFTTFLAWIGTGALFAAALSSGLNATWPLFVFAGACASRVEGEFAGRCEAARGRWLRRAVCRPLRRAVCRPLRRALCHPTCAREPSPYEDTPPSPARPPHFPRAPQSSPRSPSSSRCS